MTMATFHTTEKSGWLDIVCDGCKQGVIVPASDYGHRLAEAYPHIHQCQMAV